MFRNRKKFLSTLLASLLVAFLSLCSLHHHDKAPSVEKDKCSICQVSHSARDQTPRISGLQTQLRFSGEKAPHETPLIESSRILLSSPSRAPPALA